MAILAAILTMYMNQIYIISLGDPHIKRYIWKFETVTMKNLDCRYKHVLSEPNLAILAGILNVQISTNFIILWETPANIHVKIWAMCDKNSGL